MLLSHAGVSPILSSEESVCSEDDASAWEKTDVFFTWLLEVMETTDSDIMADMLLSDPLSIKYLAAADGELLSACIESAFIWTSGPEKPF